MVRSAFFFLLLFSALRLSAADNGATLPPCSTEIVNPSCVITIDRWYPVALPTIKMHPRASVTVKVRRPFPFESLTLDYQSGQALEGTDQVQSFVASTLGNIKGPLVPQQTNNLFNEERTPEGNPALRAFNQLSDKMRDFNNNARVVYSQLRKITGTIPLNTLEGKDARSNNEPPEPWESPDSWNQWRQRMTCELSGEQCKDLRPRSEIQGLLTTASSLIVQLAPCPGSGKLTASQKKLVSCQLHKGGLVDQENTLALYLSAVTAIQKDLTTYYANISVIPDSVGSNDPVEIGKINDPLQSGGNPRFLGRQVVFAVNALNEVSTSLTSVPATSQAKAVATITVLYAAPIFEVSAGTWFSTLPNRSFANATAVAMGTSGYPQASNVFINKTLTRPAIVPFVAANWRISPEATSPGWLGRRRVAAYFSVGIGLNPYNTVTDYAVGPSVSWRSVMFSAFYNLGHDVRLTQHEYANEVWCSQTQSSTSSGSSTVPLCTGTPPNPATETYLTSAFAFGISIRTQTLFSSSNP